MELHPLQTIWLNAHAVHEGVRAWNAVANKAAKINEQQKHEMFFGLVQRWAMNSAVLAICKIYDRPSDRYPTICVRSFLKEYSDHPKFTIIQALAEDMPTVENDKALERIFYHRDKVAAHQEKLDRNAQEKSGFLPSPEDFERLAEWAKCFADKAGEIVDIVVPGSSLCAGMATKNTIFRCLYGQIEESEGSTEKYLKFMRDE